MAGALRALTQLLALCIAAALMALLVATTVDSLHTRNRALDIAHRALLDQQIQARAHARTDRQLEHQVKVLTHQAARTTRTRIQLARNVRALTRQLRKHGITPVVVVHTTHRTAKAKHHRHAAKRHRHKKAAATPTPTSPCVAFPTLCLPNGKVPPGKSKKEGGGNDSPFALGTT